MHLPASQTRSPLQSVSLVHWALASALTNNTLAPLNSVQTARPRMVEKLAAVAAPSKEPAKAAFFSSSPFAAAGPLSRAFWQK